MKIKNKKTKSILSVIGIVALFLFISSIWANFYAFLSMYKVQFLIGSSITLFLLVILKVTSLKKIKKKVKGIFK